MSYYRADFGFMRALLELERYTLLEDQRRAAEPMAPETPAEPKTGYGTGRCAGKCGRTISLNKNLCAKCAGVETAK